MTKINVKFSFLLFNAFLFMFRDGRLIMSFYAVSLLHELGHIAALKLTGGELRSVELSFCGIKMSAAPAADLKNGAIVLLSGPAANIALYFVLRLCGYNGQTALLSLAAGIFNLLPYSFLDGGALIEMLAEGTAHELFIRRILTLVRWLIIIAATVLYAGLYAADSVLFKA